MHVRKLILCSRLVALIEPCLSSFLNRLPFPSLVLCSSFFSNNSVAQMKEFSISVFYCRPHCMIVTSRYFEVCGNPLLASHLGNRSERKARVGRVVRIAARVSLGPLLAREDPLYAPCPPVNKLSLAWLTLRSLRLAYTWLPQCHCLPPKGLGGS
jgi:hypothetical protein